MCENFHIESVTFEVFLTTTTSLSNDIIINHVAPETSTGKVKRGMKHDEAITVILVVPSNNVVRFLCPGYSARIHGESIILNRASSRYWR